MNPTLLHAMIIVCITAFSWRVKGSVLVQGKLLLREAQTLTMTNDSRPAGTFSMGTMPAEPSMSLRVMMSRTMPRTAPGWCKIGAAGEVGVSLDTVA